MVVIEIHLGSAFIYLATYLYWPTDGMDTEMKIIDLYDLIRHMISLNSIQSVNQKAFSVKWDYNTKQCSIFLWA